jgi:hypothetical protein
MKITRFLILFLLLVFALSACSAEAATPTDEVSALNAVYTVAALTVSAQSAAASPTATPKPAATATLLASPTLIPTLAAQNVAVPAAAVYASSSCDNSAYLSDVTIPDGTIFAPGEAFTKTWSFQNTGTCAWSASYSLSFVSGNAMSGSTTALIAAVSSGGQTTVSVALVAPSTTGTYTGYWKLQNAAGNSFGQSVYVQIVVSDDAATVTPTPTATDDESTYTSTPTSTAAATSTIAPTATPTATSTTAPTSTIAPTNTPEPPTNTSEPTSTPETPASA